MSTPVDPSPPSLSPFATNGDTETRIPHNRGAYVFLVVAGAIGVTLTLLSALLQRNGTHASALVATKVLEQAQYPYGDGPPPRVPPAGLGVTGDPISARFDEERALDEMAKRATAALDCLAPTAASAMARVRVTFEPSGTSRDARIEGANPLLETCIISNFRGLRVAPFTGPPATLTTGLAWIHGDVRNPGSPREPTDLGNSSF